MSRQCRKSLFKVEGAQTVDLERDVPKTNGKGVKDPGETYENYPWLAMQDGVFD